MDYLYVIITSFVSLIVLFLLTKLVGNKQLSELNMFDYIVSITIGSIAAEMSTELEKPEKPLIAMTVYALLSFIISVAASKLPRLRRLIFGRSVVLMRGGKMFRENFKKSRLDLSEFLMQCRLNGFYDVSAIDTAVMEASGKISFMPYATRHPATPEDLNVTVSPEMLFFSVIMDGHLLENNLRAAGRDINWLKSELHSQGADISEVFLGMLDSNGTLNIFRNEPGREKNDPFS